MKHHKTTQSVCGPGIKTGLPPKKETLFLVKENYFGKVKHEENPLFSHIFDHHMSSIGLPTGAGQLQAHGAELAAVLPKSPFEHAMANKQGLGVVLGFQQTVFMLFLTNKKKGFWGGLTTF